MHELAMKKCIGKPIPEWDASTPFRIDQSTGPNLQDFGTIFRINSNLHGCNLSHHSWKNSGLFRIHHLLRMPP